MEKLEQCASGNEADKIICELWGPNWQDVLITREGQVIQRCDRCKQCQRAKPQS